MRTGDARRSDNMVAFRQYNDALRRRRVGAIEGRLL